MLNHKTGSTGAHLQLLNEATVRVVVEVVHVSYKVCKVSNCQLICKLSDGRLTHVVNMAAIFANPAPFPFLGQVVKDAVHGLPLPRIRFVENHHADEDHRTGVDMTATVDIESVALCY